MNQQQNKNAKPPGEIVNWPLIACISVGLPLELVLHNVMTFGVRSVGPRAGAAVLLMVLWLTCYPAQNVVPLTCFLIGVIALSIIAQTSATFRWWRGKKTNTRYNGKPYAMWLLPHWKEVTIKRLEPVLALLLAWVIHHFNHPLGTFLITSAIGLGIRVAVEHRMIRELAMDMNDAMIQQKIALETLRNMQRR
jgi:hypothetical protein